MKTTERASKPPGRHPGGQTDHQPRWAGTAPLPGPCRPGGTGRRAGPRHRCPKGRGGSSPSVGTIREPQVRISRGTNGSWRSLVACPLRDRGAARSNRADPTTEALTWPDDSRSRPAHPHPLRSRPRHGDGGSAPAHQSDETSLRWQSARLGPEGRPFEPGRLDHDEGVRSGTTTAWPSGKAAGRNPVQPGSTPVPSPTQRAPPPSLLHRLMAGRGAITAETRVRFPPVAPRDWRATARYPEGWRKWHRAGLENHGPASRPVGVRILCPPPRRREPCRPCHATRAPSRP